MTLAFADELETRGISRERWRQAWHPRLAVVSEDFGRYVAVSAEWHWSVGLWKAIQTRKAAAEKQDHYKRIQKLVKAFKDENGSYICRELLAGINTDTNPMPEARTESYYKNAHAQSLQPVQRIFWRDTWKNYRNRIEFPILRRKELISEVSLWQQKMTRRKSDGSFCRYILHNKLCKLLYSELEDSSRKSNAYARSERKSDHHPDNNYDDPCDLKNDGHRDHIEIRVPILRSGTYFV